MGAKLRAINEYYARFIDASGKAADAKGRNDFGGWVHQNRRAEEAARRLGLLGVKLADMPPLVSMTPLVAQW